MKKILFLTILLMISFTAAQDLRMVVLNPYAIFTLNESETLNYYVGIQNKNEFPITVNINLPETNSSFTIEETNVTLDINETRYINLTYKPNTNETINIPIEFSNGNQTGMLSSTIMVIVNKKEIVPVSTSGGSGGSSKKEKSKKEETRVAETPNTTKVAAEETKLEETPNTPKEEIKELPKVKINYYLLAFLIVIVILGILTFIKIKLMKGGVKNEKTINNVGADDSTNDNDSNGSTSESE